MAGSDRSSIERGCTPASSAIRVAASAPAARPGGSAGGPRRSTRRGARPGTAARGRGGRRGPPVSSARSRPSTRRGGASQLRSSQLRTSASGAISAVSVSSNAAPSSPRFRSLSIEAGGQGGGSVIQRSARSGMTRRIQLRPRCPELVLGIDEGRAQQVGQESRCLGSPRVGIRCRGVARRRRLGLAPAVEKPDELLRQGRIAAPANERDPLDPLDRVPGFMYEHEPRRSAVTRPGSGPRDRSRPRRARGPPARRRAAGRSAGIAGRSGRAARNHRPTNPPASSARAHARASRIVPEIVERHRRRPAPRRLRSGIAAPPRRPRAASPAWRVAGRARVQRELDRPAPGHAPERVRRALDGHQPVASAPVAEIDCRDAEHDVGRHPAADDPRHVVARREGDPADPHRAARRPRGCLGPAAKLRRQVAPLGLRPGRDDEQLLGRPPRSRKRAAPSTRPSSQSRRRFADEAGSSRVTPGEIATAVTPVSGPG